MYGGAGSYPSEYLGQAKRPDFERATTKAQAAIEAVREPLAAAVHAVAEAANLAPDESELAKWYSRLVGLADAADVLADIATS